jgi:hypothetical protein
MTQVAVGPGHAVACLAVSSRRSAPGIAVGPAHARPSTVGTGCPGPATRRATVTRAAAVRAGHTAARHTRRPAVLIARATARCSRRTRAPTAPSGDTGRSGGSAHRGRGQTVRAGRRTSGNRRAPPCRATARSLARYPCAATGRAVRTATTGRAVRANTTGRAVRANTTGRAVRTAAGAGVSDRGTAWYGGAHRLSGTRRKRGRAPPSGAVAVGAETAVPPGVFLGLGRETPRSVGTDGAPARTGLLGHGHGAAVLAGLRSALATAGTLDHAGGAVGHRAGPSRDDGSAGALTARNDRRDHRGAPHRPPVAGPDATRTGNVRSAGEATDLGLVGVGALVRVTAAAFLAPGQPLGAAADDVVGARVAAGLDEPVCTGVGPRLHEAVRAGVRSGLDESVRAGAGPQHAVR